MANLTNVHWYSTGAGAWGPNLLGMAPPYPLLPPAPAAGDVVVFGIDTAIPDSGPFCSLVFDLLTAQVDLTTVTWRYSDAGVDPTAWGALTPIQDNTNADGLMTGDPFDTTGDKSVHWMQPAAWVDTLDPTIGGNALGVTGYWVCAHVSVVGGAPVAPVQQTNHPYTITWPFVEIAEDDAPLGDVAALLRSLIRNQSDTGVPGLIGYSNRFVIGLRSLSRGSNFTAYINLANEQNPPSITVASTVFSTFVADVIAPTGVVLQINNPVVAASAAAEITLTGTLPGEYRGRFHCFIRGRQITGAGGDVSISVEGGYGGGGHFWESERVAFQNTNDWQLLDMGSVYIPGRVAASESWLIYFLIYAYGNGVSDAELYDMILIPTDEWAVDCVDAENRGGLTLNSKSAIYARGNASLHTYLDLDGRVAYPKQRTALGRRYLDDGVASAYIPITAADPVLQANTGQRLWFLSTRYSAVGSTEQRSEIWIANTVRLSSVARYLSMRGDR